MLSIGLSKSNGLMQVMFVLGSDVVNELSLL